MFLVRLVASGSMKITELAFQTPKNMKGMDLWKSKRGPWGPSRGALRRFGRRVVFATTIADSRGKPAVKAVESGNNPKPEAKTDHSGTHVGSWAHLCRKKNLLSFAPNIMKSFICPKFAFFHRHQILTS
jgi:hypothetical protein